ncbi:NADPH:quinone oxidoreductase family protein [Chachezhania antarctica]|uniref:NADPH:quinone oxidoreductase family protein n=1 Tax=Chachezhania antarctica TaxID=2340860 RepID=UPI000EB2349D|nr:NADPH:quinone oxidoreductase family protein [Chachezhania antarctica]|tara:strand:- start:5307 stop:6299 length:993 start_codon:yes stop_codon:yes gene_type:complete
MKAMLSTAPGGPETLELTEMPDPAPDKGQVTVRVRAAGVNFPDTLIIKDLYQLKPERPFAPGGEIAGEVVTVGEGVTDFAVGDRVLGMTGFGGFVTHLNVDADRLMKIPDSMPFDEASCLTLTYGTSYHAIKDRAEMKPGEKLLILGAAGGVGTAAIELAKAMGIEVIAAVSTRDKADFCKMLGADHTIVYDRDLDRDGQKAFSDEIKKISGGGVDVVYDAVGGSYAEPSLRALNWKGRFLVVGFPAGIPKIPLNLTLLKGCQIVGVFWGAHTRAEPELHEANIKDLFRMHGEGKIKPHISAKLPLAQAGDALQLFMDRKVLGKVVLDTD